jgi:hypothetical protein
MLLDLIGTVKIRTVGQNSKNQLSKDQDSVGSVTISAARQTE